MISYNTFTRLWIEANEDKDINHYIFNRGWQDWMDSMRTMNEITDVLRWIHVAERGGLHAIVRDMKMSEFSERYGVPEDLLQDWYDGRQEMPPYALTLLTYAVVSDVFRDQ